MLDALVHTPYLFVAIMGTVATLVCIVIILRLCHELEEEGARLYAKTERHPSEWRRAERLAHELEQERDRRSATQSMLHIQNRRAERLAHELRKSESKRATLRKALRHEREKREAQP